MPRDWSEITPAWLGAALGQSVAGVWVTHRADGTNARATLELTYDGPPGPERLFVKREGSWINRLALTALGARDAEVGLAVSGLELPVEHPEFVAAASDPRRLANVVVMEDVTLRGATPHVMTEPLTAEQVAAGLQQLARLHRRYRSQPIPISIKHWRQGGVWGPVATAGFAQAHRRLRGLGRGDLVVASPRRLTGDFLGWAKIAASGPQTLLHGDPHLANTYHLPDSTVGFLDWQLVRRGQAVHDVAYFLTSSLTVEDRRAHERDLLAEYAREAGHSVDEDAYRAGAVFGLASWLQTLAGGGFQPVETCLAAIERFAAAYVDAG